MEKGLLQQINEGVIAKLTSMKQNNNSFFSNRNESTKNQSNFAFTRVQSNENVDVKSYIERKTAHSHKHTRTPYAIDISQRFDS